MNGVSGQAMLSFDTANKVSFYSSLSANTRIISAAAVNDGNPHLWTVTHDGTTAVIYKDGVSVASGALTMPVADDRSLRLHAARTGSDPFNVMEGYSEMFVVGDSVDAALRPAIKAVVAERHPGWSLA